MFGASKPFGGTGFGATSATSAFGTQSTPFGGTGGGLFGNKTPAANTFGTPSFGSTTPSSGLFGGTSTGTNLFGSKTTQASSGFGFGTSTGGLFGGGSSVFQAPTSSFSFGGGSTTGTTVKFVPPTSSEQAQKGGISLTIKTQNQCITVMEQYKNKSVEELRMEDYTAGRKTGAASTFGSSGTGLFGGQTSSSGGLFGSSTSTGGFGGFGKTTTSGGMFGQPSGGLFGAKTTSSLFGTATTTTSAFGFGSVGGGLFGKSSASTGLFGSTTTTASTGLFGSGFSAATSGSGLFGGTAAFGGQAVPQSTSVFGQPAKPTFGFGTTTGGFGAASTGGLFGGTSSSGGGLFGSTVNKPSFSFGGASGGFGTGTAGGFGGFGSTTSSSGGLFGGSSTGNLFGNKPTGFGSTAFSATSSGSLFGGTNLGGTGFGQFGNTQNTGTGFTGCILGTSNIDQGMLAALQQQQMIQQQVKALANTPFGDSPLFRNLTEPAKAKSTANRLTVTSIEPVNTSQYKVLSRPAARIKPQPISSPSLGKSQLFEGLEEEGDFSPHPLVPRRSVKKLIINKTETVSPYEEGRLKLRSILDEDLVSPSLEVVKRKEPEFPKKTNNSKSKTPFIDTISELNHEESTPVGRKTKDYVITPLPTSDDSLNENVESGDTIINELPKCKLIMTRPEYYTKPSVSELDKIVNEEQCLVKGFTVGREGYGEVKFLGVTNVYGLDIDQIITFRSKEVEVYDDDYENKPEIGQDLNKPAEITLLNLWPNDKTTHTPIKTLQRLKESGFIDRIEEKTAALGAIFIDYQPKEGAWVFKVNHFTRYGMQEEFIDDGFDADTLPLVQGKLHLEAVSNVSESNIEEKQEIEIKIDSLHLEREANDNMDTVVDDIVPEQDYSEIEDFLPASHQLSWVADVQPFSLQGMKTSLLCDDDVVSGVTVKKKKKQLFSNKTIFDSFAESSKPGSPFPKLNLSSSVQVQDPLNSIVFQNISLCEPGVSSVVSATKFQKKLHLLPCGASKYSKETLKDDSTQAIDPRGSDKLFIKYQNFQMVPFDQSYIFAKSNLHSDAALLHGREFNVRWCNNMDLLHCGKRLGLGISSKKIIASVFIGNFISSSSMFSLDNSTVHVESIAKNTSADLKQFLSDFLQISLENSVFDAGNNSVLDMIKLKNGVDALSDYAEKAESYKLASVSVDIAEFRMHSCVWELISALWGKQDYIESVYDIHAARRDAFSQWLSTTIDSDVQKEISIEKTKDQGHLSVIFSLLSANKIRDACKVARENKELRLAFLLSQITGDYLLKSYMRNQLCLWEERDIDMYVDDSRLKLFVLLSGLMVWKSVKSTTSINVCENMDWKQALALHLWYHCAPSASINDAFLEYQNSFKGTGTFDSYSPYPSPSYQSPSTADNINKTKDICYHILSLYCKHEHSLAKLLSPKTYTSAPLDYHLSWHVHEVLYALGYTHLSEDKHNLLQHSYAAELELVGLWHWAVFILMHLRDDSRREYCVKELLNRYCRVSDNEDNIFKFSEEENIIINKFHVPKQWVHEAKALHANFVARHYDEALHLMRAGHWNQAHVVVLKHLTCDAIIEEDHEMLKNMLSDMNYPERCCMIKNWRIGGQVFLDYILLSEKLNVIQQSKVVISTYHLEDMEGEVASLINRVSMLRTENTRERHCQSEMARNCSRMQKFVLTYTNINEGNSDETQKWSSMKVTPYVVNLPLTPDYYLKELRELLDHYANEIEESERSM